MDLQMVYHVGVYGCLNCTGDTHRIEPFVEHSGSVVELLTLD